MQDWTTNAPQYAWSVNEDYRSTATIYQYGHKERNETEADFNPIPDYVIASFFYIPPNSARNMSHNHSHNDSRSNNTIDESQHD